MIVRARIGRFTQQLPHLPAALRLVWQATPRYTTLWGLLLLAQGLLPVATVYLTRSAVDSLAAAFDDPTTLSQAILTVLLLAAVLLTAELLRGANRWVQTAQSEYVTNYVKRLVHQQAIALDLSYYETPAYYDMLHRARVDATNMPLSLVQNLGRLLQNGLTLAAMMGVLLPFGIWIPFALLFGTLPAVAVVLRVNWRLHRWQHERATLRRRVNYYDWLVTNRQTAAEIRLFGLGRLFIDRFQVALTQLREERLKLVREESLADLFAAGLGLLTIGATLAVLTWQTVNGGGSLGDLALFYQAFSQGQRLAATLLGSVGQIYKNLLFLENLFDFLALEPRLPEQTTAPEAMLTAQTAVSFNQAITFDNVSFHYPQSEQQALDNFSLTIPQGKLVAIVGENGAGKSTLIKLLTRLYDPTGGRIMLDGQDIRTLPLAELRRLFTVLFQVPVQYHQSAYENVALGDWWAEPGGERVETAVLAAGADAPITKLPDGLDTILGKRFGGAELSVGEWQRVALARAFLRQAEVIILDEPTSAMDSWAEGAWLARFRDLVMGKTAVVITHRFTTAMQADIIHVMVGGNIVESGSHETLLAKGGMYAESWLAQTQSPSTKLAAD